MPSISSLSSPKLARECVARLPSAAFLQGRHNQNKVESQMRNALSAFMTLIFLLSPSLASPNYVLVVGMAESKRWYTFDVNRNGMISLPPQSFDFSKDSEFWDANQIITSKDGKYILFVDFNCYSAAIYGVGSDVSFSFKQLIARDCSGGSFTNDDQYLVSSTNYSHYARTNGFMNVMECNNASDFFDVVSTATVPTTATLTKIVMATSRDEFFGSTRNGYISSDSGGALYQLNRQTKQLELRQYWDPRVSGVDVCALSAKEDRIVFAGRQSKGNGDYITKIGLLVRKQDNTWEMKTPFLPSTWGRGGVMPIGIGITPDMRYVAVATDDHAGIDVFEFNDGDTLTLHSSLPFYRSSFLAMSPDGKYLAISTDFSQNISIVRLYPNGNLEETHRINNSSGTVGCMAFLPQALPPAAADDDCALYGESIGGDASASAKKSRMFGKPGKSAKHSEWTSSR
jgi:hypothetical protein